MAKFKMQDTTDILKPWKDTIDATGTDSYNLQKMWAFA